MQEQLLYIVVLDMFFISFANFIDLSKSESASVMYPIDSAMIAFKENIT
jgi:hypothetical protein